jgi:hypothetical protein
VFQIVPVHKLVGAKVSPMDAAGSDPSRGNGHTQAAAVGKNIPSLLTRMHPSHVHACICCAALGLFISGRFIGLQVKLQDLQLICQEDVKSPFKHIPWKQGYMHFSYELVRFQPSAKLCSALVHLVSWLFLYTRAIDATRKLTKIR